MSRFVSQQRGQATVEWVGLLLGLALVLAALAAGGREAAGGESRAQLGEAVAERITCAARDLCKGGSGLGLPRRGEPPATLRRPPAALRRAPGGPRGVRPSAPWEAPPRHSSLPKGLRPPRGVTGFAKRAWMVCLGYRRWRYEIEHPMTPRQAVPVRETLKWVNECVNPLSFFFG